MWPNTRSSLIYRLQKRRGKVPGLILSQRTTTRSWCRYVPNACGAVVRSRTVRIWRRGALGEMPRLIRGLLQRTGLVPGLVANCVTQPTAGPYQESKASVPVHPGQAGARARGNNWSMPSSAVLVEQMYKVILGEVSDEVGARDWKVALGPGLGGWTQPARSRAEDSRGSREGAWAERSSSAAHPRQGAQSA